jgi:hypothetical protein
MEACCYVCMQVGGGCIAAAANGQAMPSRHGTTAATSASAGIGGIASALPSSMPSAPNFMHAATVAATASGMLNMQGATSVSPLQPNMLAVQQLATAAGAWLLSSPAFAQAAAALHPLMQSQVAPTHGAASATATAAVPQAVPVEGKQRCGSCHQLLSKTGRKKHVTPKEHVQSSCQHSTQSSTPLEKRRCQFDCAVCGMPMISHPDRLCDRRCGLRYAL